MHIDDFGADRSAESRSANAAQARWQQQGVLDLAPSLIHSDEPGEPVLPGRVLELQGVQMAMLNHGPIQVRRPTSLIRQFDPEAYNINLFLAGDGGLSQAGRQAAMTAGQFVVLDTSRPYEGWRRCDRSSAPHSTLTLQIPRLMMPLPSNVADRLTAVAFDTRHGMGAVFARWVTGLVRDPGYFTHDDVSTLASVTTTLLAAALAPHVNSALHDSSEARRRRLRFQIDDFIQRTGRQRRRQRLRRPHDVGDTRIRPVGRGREINGRRRSRSRARHGDRSGGRWSHGNGCRPPLDRGALPVRRRHRAPGRRPARRPVGREVSFLRTQGLTPFPDGVARSWCGHQVTGSSYTPYTWPSCLKGIFSNSAARARVGMRL
ncbi:AraC-like ligand-binding domain-containing protein [Nonomuraea sp. NPDC001684]